jgi:hypothetical protein
MADYSSAGFNTLYSTLLGLSSGNITGSLKTVQDGDGNNTALQVSTATVKSTGTLESAGAATIGGTCSAVSYTGDASGLTNVASAIVADRTLTTSGSISDGDQLLIMNGSSLNLTVNTAADVGGRLYRIMNIASTPVTIVTGGERIIGLGSTSTSDRTLAPYTSITIISSNNVFNIVT